MPIIPPDLSISTLSRWNVFFLAKHEAWFILKIKILGPYLLGYIVLIGVFYNFSDDE